MYRVSRSTFVLARALNAIRHYRSSSAASSQMLNVYDPKADEAWEPPVRENLRGPRFADFRSDTGSILDRGIRERDLGIGIRISD